MLIHSLLNCFSSSLAKDCWLCISMLATIYMTILDFSIPVWISMPSQSFLSVFTGLCARNCQPTDAGVDFPSVQSCVSGFFLLGCPLSPFAKPGAAVRLTPTSLFLYLLLVYNNKTQACKAVVGPDSPRSQPTYQQEHSSQQGTQLSTKICKPRLP